MLIVYCEKCGLRINEKELSAGTAIALDDSTHYCARCVTTEGIKPKAKTTTKIPSRSTEMRAVGAGRSNDRNLAVDSEFAPAKSSSPLPMIGLIGAVVLLLGGYFAFSGSSTTSTSSKATTAPTNSVTNNNFGASTSTTTTTTTTTSGTTSKTADPDEDPNQKRATRPDENDPEFGRLRVVNAARRLDDIKARFKSNPKDPWLYQDNLKQVASTYRGTPAATEAEKLLAELKLPEEGRPGKYWIRDWQVDNAVDYIVEDYGGRANVLRFHPVDQQIGGRLHRKITVPADKPFLCFSATAHAQGDVELQVIIDGKELLAEPLYRTQWRAFAFDLTALKGKESLVEIFANRMNGYSYDHQYIETPRFAAAAPPDAVVVTTAAPSGNLLRDPGFESGVLAEWTATGAVTLAGEARSGKFTAALQPGARVEQTVRDLKPNTMYKFTAYGRAPDKGQLTIAATDGVKEYGQTLSNAQWGRASQVFTTAANATSVRIAAHTTATAKSAAQVDDFVLTPLSALAVAAYSVPPLAAAPEMDWARGIELLPLIDPAQDALAGKWSRAADTLVGAPEPGRIQIPYQPPDEYDLKVVFTPVSGEVHVVASTRGRNFIFILGGWGNTVFGYDAIAGISAENNSSTVRRTNPALVKNQKYTAILQVRNDGLRTILNGELLTFHRTSDYNEMTIWEGHKMKDANVLGLLSFGGGATFHSVQIAELSGPGKALRQQIVRPTVPELNLLALVDVAKDAAKGKWTRTADTLVSPENNLAKLEIPYVPPAEYNLIVEFTQPDAPAPLGICLNAGGRQVSWWIHSYDTWCGFDIVKGKRTNENITSVNRGIVPSGKRHTCELRVRNGSMIALIDGEQATKFSGANTDLDLHEMWALRSKEVLGLYTKNAPTIFHAVRIQELGGNGKTLRGAAPPAVAKGSDGPPPPPVGDNKAEYERYATEFYGLLAAGSLDQAGARVESARKQSTLAGSLKRLEHDAALLKLAGDLRDAVGKGATALLDGQAFTFKFKQGKDVAVGKGSKNTVKEVKPPAISVEMEFGGGRAFKKYSLDEMTLETHTQLMAVGLPPGPETELRLALREVLALCTHQCADTLKTAKIRLDIAGKAKAEPDLLAHLRERVESQERQLGAPRAFEKITELIVQKKYEDAQAAMNTFKADLAGTKALEKLQARVAETAAQIDKLLNPLKPGLHGFFYKIEDPKVNGSAIVTTTELNWAEHAPVEGCPADNFASRLNGLLRVETEGPYEFSVNGDDSVEVFIDGKSVVKCVGNEVDKRAAVQLTKGDHPIRIVHVEGVGGARIHLRWKPGTQETQAIPAGALWHDPDKIPEYQKP